MANFTTLTDLVKYALFRAGEFTDSLADGDFYNGDDGGRVIGYINDCVEGLLLGSPLGLLGESNQPMPSVDWWWARKDPPGVLHLVAPITTGTVSITKGQTRLTFSTLLTGGGGPVYGTGVVYGSGAVYGGPVDLTGYRIRIGTSAYLPRIVSTDTTGATTIATIDSPWPDTTVSAGTFTTFKLEYDLPTDFLRFFGEPTLSADPWQFSVMDESVMNQAFPIAQTQAGIPQMAALIAPQKIRLSHYPDDRERVEFPYIYLPAAFTVADMTSTTLVLPPHHRRILAVGAAYYIAYDKADTKAGDLRTEFLGLYRAMVQEHNKHSRKMSERYGSYHYRLAEINQRRLRSTSGLIY